MPLTTRCRHCGRLFAVSAQQLKERRGRVACPGCHKRFDAIRGLLDEAVPVATTVAAKVSGAVGGIAPGTGHAGPAAGPDLSGWARDVPSGQTPAPTWPRPSDELPALVAAPARAGRGRGVLWVFGVLLLAAALVLQIGWWERGTLLRDPRVRAAADRVCATLGCRIDLPLLAGTIQVRHPVLRPLGEDRAQLRLTLTLVNESDIVQRLPHLQLELYDSEGGLAAARRFAPHEYLAAADIDKGIAPGRAVRPTLDLAPLPVPATRFRVALY